MWGEGAQQGQESWGKGGMREVECAKLCVGKGEDSRGSWMGGGGGRRRGKQECCGTATWGGSGVDMCSDCWGEDQGDHIPTPRDAIGKIRVLPGQGASNHQHGVTEER